MAEIILYHHVMGLAPGVTAFADQMRSAGHVVHTPDSFDALTFGTLRGRNCPRQNGRLRHHRRPRRHRGRGSGT